MRGPESLSRNADPYRRPHRQGKKKHCRDAESSSAPKRGGLLLYLPTQSGLRVLPLFAFADDGRMDGCRGKKETASVHQRHRRRASNFTRPFSHTVRGKKVCSNDERRSCRRLLFYGSFVPPPSLLSPFPLCGMLVPLGKTTLSSS